MPTHHPSSRRQLLLAGLGLSLLAGCSKKNRAQGKLLEKDATLLCLGDSLTFGFGAAAGASYPQQLERLTGHVTQNAGRNGDTAEGALLRLPQLLEENKPGLVLVSIGGNDFLRKLPLDRTKEAIREIVRTALASAQVVLIAEPAPDALAAFAGALSDHAVYAEIAAETGVPLFTEGWSHVLSREALRSDRIHANAEGYKIFAERLADWLRQAKFIA
jgi:acyl-CoA thioesterase-1